MVDDLYVKSAGGGSIEIATRPKADPSKVKYSSGEVVEVYEGDRVACEMGSPWVDVTYVAKFGEHHMIKDGQKRPFLFQNHEIRKVVNNGG